MTENKLKRRLGLFLVASHLCVLFSAIISKLVGGLSVDEFTTVLAVVTPMFAGFTGAVIAFFVENRHVATDSSPKITRTFSNLALLLPGVLVALTIMSIFLKSINVGFSDFEDMKRFLIAMESLLAAYISTIVFTLFPKSPAQASGVPLAEDNKP